MSNGGAKAAVAPVGGPLPLDWKLSQVFGERPAGEEVQEDWCTMIKVLNHDFAVNCGNFFCIVGVIENGEKIPSEFTNDLTY
ncbi:hypothetical protein GQ457_12G010830 [Hibiscus cannabinus]